MKSLNRLFSAKNRDQRGFTLMEIIVGSGIMALLILFTTPILTYVVGNFQKRMQSDSNISSRLQLKKHYNRSLMAVNPIRFDPSATLVGEVLQTEPWKMPNNLVIAKEDVPTFLIDNRPVRQDSFNIELYNIDFQDGKAVKVNHGALLSRCATQDVHNEGISLSQVLDLDRPYLEMKNEQCCQGSLCRSCRKYSISCCDASKGACKSDPELLPMVFVVNKDQMQIYPAKSDLITTPGIGFMLSFDNNPVRSYTLYEFRYINRCLLNEVKRASDCPKDVMDYFTKSQFKPFLQFEVSSTTNNVVSNLNDGSFISIGDKVLGEF